MAPSPPAAAASGGQYAQQFLNTALSQRGPSALPYAEDVKWLIRNHLVALADAFASLHPRAALFTHNDGCATHLLQADGTIPITHAGAVYNLPAVLWLPEPYPRAPPLVFLSPTRDMLVKPHHPLVDRSGLVAGVPYLRSWVFPSSNLVDLVRSLSHLFGLDPPLFTRSNPPPPLPTAPSSSSMPPAPSPRPPSEAGVYAPGPYRFPASPQLAARPPPAEDPAEVFRRNAIAKLIDMAYADAAALRTSCKAEVDALFAVRAELRGRGNYIDGGVCRIAEEMEALEHRLQDVTMATDVIEAWVAENRKGPADDDGTKAEGAIQPADALSRQMLDCTAADLALEDAIYALDKAVQEGSVPFDGYLKSVRALAREQFFQRVLYTKVNSAQAQVARMAARAARQYAS